MASTTRSVNQKALHSSVAKKAIMAVTGLVLVAFLLMHMYGNLKIFIGPEDYNHYANFLKQDLLYPILPKGWFIWIFRGFLAICLVLHMYCAMSLALKARRARGGKYVKTKRRDESYSARTMRVGGIMLALLLIFHIMMFTTNTFKIGWSGKAEPYDMFVGAFASWWVVLIYVVFMGVVSMHVRHGFWSAFTTLGANVGPNARMVLNALGYFVAALLFVGFLLPPFAVLFGLVS